MSVRRQVAELRQTMQANGAAPHQIAEAIATLLGVNSRVAWRLATGLTQEQVADLYNMRWPSPVPKTGKQVSYWERWEGPGSRSSTSARAPSHLDLSRLAVVYGSTVDDLLSMRTGGRADATVAPEMPGTPGYAEILLSDVESEEDATNRREMLASMTAAGAALVGLPPVLRAAIPDRIGPEQAAEVRRLTAMYRGWVYEHGASGQLQCGVARLLGHATSLINRTSHQPIRDDLLDALADVAGLAAYACRDLGLQDYAAQHYVIAFQAAKASGNHALAGHTVVRMAGHNIELARPREVLDYLDAAQGIGKTRGFTPGELSNQYAIKAWAFAQSGRAQEVHRAVGMAEEHAALAEDRSGPDWRIRHVAEAELFSLTGAGYAELSKHSPAHAPEAIWRLTKAIDLRGFGGARNATLDNISLAEAHLATHDLEGAAAVGYTAVEAAGTSSSRRVRVRLGELRRQLEPHTKHPDVADLATRISRL
ncbi:hypothetical protein [Acrocarpospora sp. B8E8]|uniref:hypothetical protein n=1 Tax=Acrocarpospora sp. B8E8 TaxID=3153572 RepID=UPI00325EBD49